LKGFRKDESIIKLVTHDHGDLKRNVERIKMAKTYINTAQIEM